MMTYMDSFYVINLQLGAEMLQVSHTVRMARVISPLLFLLFIFLDCHKVNSLVNFC